MPAIQYPFSDLTLSRRLEKMEGVSNSEFVSARAALFPEVGAEWMEVAGAYALYDGVGSPATQTFGLGLFQPAEEKDLETLEAFYKDRGAEVNHEVSPLTDQSLHTLLSKRGYHPIELTSILYRPIHKTFRVEAPLNEQIHVRRVKPGEEAVWAQVAADGWREFGDMDALMQDVGQIYARRENAVLMMAELDGRPIASSALAICEGVLHLAGASTIPDGRRQGAQLALLEHRLRFGAEQGCDIAMMGALPGSASQRNAERHGFRIAYTRIKWQMRELTD